MPSASVRDSSMASLAGHPRDPETRSVSEMCADGSGNGVQKSPTLAGG